MNGNKDWNLVGKKNKIVRLNSTDEKWLQPSHMAIPYDEKKNHPEYQALIKKLNQSPEEYLEQLSQCEGCKK